MEQTELDYDAMTPDLDDGVPVSNHEEPEDIGVPHTVEQEQ